MAVLTAWAQAQHSVIGSLLRDPDEWAGQIFQSATPAMFGDKALRHLFEAAREIWSAGVPVDPVTLGARAGTEYTKTIFECVELTPTAANTDAYLKILREQAQLNAMQVEALSITTAENVEAASESYEKIGKMLASTEDVEDYSLTEMIGMYIDRMNDPTPPARRARRRLRFSLRCTSRKAGRRSAFSVWRRRRSPFKTASWPSTSSPGSRSPPPSRRSSATRTSPGRRRPGS